MDHKSTNNLKLDESLGKVNHCAIKYSIKIENYNANTSKCERNEVINFGERKLKCHFAK